MLDVRREMLDVRRESEMKDVGRKTFRIFGL